MRPLYCLFALLWTLSAAAAPTLTDMIELRAQTPATPAIAQGRLYIGAEDGNLYAFDAASRKLAWLYHAGAGIASTPAVADGLVYVLARDGRVHAVDTATGVRRWTFATGGESRFAAFGLYGMAKGASPTPDPWDFWLSSPVVHGGRIYVGSSDERLYALDAKTGAVAWAFKTGGMIHARPAIAGDAVVFGSWDGAVYTLDAATGAQRWRYQTQTEQRTSTLFGVQAPPLVDGDTVFIGSRDGHFYALDLATGAMRWRYDARGSWVITGAVADRERVYFGTSDTQRLVALDKRTGRVVYEHDAKVWVYATPLLVNGSVVGASMRGELFALEAATGTPRWTWRTPEGQADAFRLMDGAGRFDGKRLFEGSHTAQEAIEHVKRLGAFVASPVLVDGTLVATTADGRLLFFARP